MDPDDASRRDKRTIESDPIGALLAKWQRDAFIEKLGQLPDVAEIIPSGSLARGTQIGPVHDVDLIVVFERSEHPDYGSGRESARAAMEHLQAELHEQPRPWSGAEQGQFRETELRTHVVTYHGVSAGPYADIIPSPPPVDVMPAVREGSHLLIPERGTGWIDIDPQKFMRQVEQRQREWTYFTEVVGMVKAWAEHDNLNMKNLAVEVMVLKYCPRPALFERLSRGEAVARFFEAAAKANITRLEDPAGRSGEIDPGMNYTKLRAALNRAAGLSRQAMDAEYTWENHFQISEDMTHPDVFWQALSGRKYPQARRPLSRASEEFGLHDHDRVQADLDASLPPEDIRLTLADRAALQHELASVYDDDRAIQGILRATTFPLGAIPAMASFSAEEAWEEILLQASQGRIQAGHYQILAAALRPFPYNQVFRRLAENYLQPPAHEVRYLDPGAAAPEARPAG